MKIVHQIRAKKGQIAILIDPEKTQTKSDIDTLVKKATFAKVDYFFVGGSTVLPQDFIKTINYLKQATSLPVVIFPGDYTQFSEKADALLYLSLLSGRNPEYLIGQHVKSAQQIYHSSIEVIPTAYILIDGGTQSSVAYVSQTSPIPQEHISIAVNTALAGILQGKQLVYFDAGSGARYPVRPELIQELRKENDIPLIVGGGIHTVGEIEAYSKAGVNVIVIGNKIEEDMDFLLEIEAFKRSAL